MLLLPLLLFHEPLQSKPVQAKPDQEPIFEVQKGQWYQGGALPIIALNVSNRSGEDMAFIEAAGLPAIEKYHEGVIRYYEHSPYISGSTSRHLLIQLALTNDSRRMQLIVVHGSHDFASGYKAAPARVTYAPAADFYPLARQVAVAAGKLPYYDSNHIVVCSHEHGARIDMRIPREIDIGRGGACQSSSQQPAVQAGMLMIAAAEKIVGEKIERAAKFDR